MLDVRTLNFICGFLFNSRNDVCLNSRYQEGKFFYFVCSLGPYFLYVRQPVYFTARRRVFPDYASNQKSHILVSAFCLSLWDFTLFVKECITSILLGCHRRHFHLQGKFHLISCKSIHCICVFMRSGISALLVSEFIIWTS